MYAGNHSPLTDAVNNLGLKAVRFTKKDGDLSTFAGRRKLWQLVDELQPEHIFVAPECGPWGGWNKLNSQKSVRLWDTIHSRQEHERQHIRLCARLFEYQKKRNRFFHLEQPMGSSMIQQPEFHVIQKNTKRAVFDMCSFGLKIPNTQKYIKKHSQIWTNHPAMHSFLDKCQCPANHDHQVIEGNIRTFDGTIRLSQFCATYCQGFAKAIARVIQQSIKTDLVLAMEEERPLKIW